VYKYVARFKQAPTKKILKGFAAEYASTKATIDRYSDALLLLDELPQVEPREFDFYLHKAENCAIGRAIFDAAEELKSEFERADELDFRAVQKKLVNQLIFAARDESGISRGFIHDRARQRWSAYADRSKGIEDGTAVPFGIKSVDDLSGGMRKSYLALVYSRTGGGKTRFAINVAYNNALAKRNVVYLSLEMNMDFLATCFDARMALVDSQAIMQGKLKEQERRRFKQALQKQVMDKLGIWIVDIPSNATPLIIMRELDLYRAATGLVPDLVCLDYSNLCLPIGKYDKGHEKYDVLFKEFHEIARRENVALLTLTAEKRTATEVSKMSKKADKEDLEGVENIALSNSIAYHCEFVMRLRSNKFDRLQNRIWGIIDKHRYGRNGDEIPMVALMEYSYIGDRDLPDRSPATKSSHGYGVGGAGSKR
jgi:replicative DNA helicase